MSEPSAPTTISGRVVEGVEVGCLLLDTGADEYLLVIPKRIGRSAVRAGTRMVLRGRVEPGFVSYCQQGIPFLVSEILPA